ncbi:succinate CoA transferase [Succiniclasticum ruminis]|jgi:succinyl-CoA:acetate CoA-transferase|uniref:Succinyl-CoA:acetate CoA-transferase n=1 Tax=Succiniclasticum ruminis DSM 9236 TaxID=1123323 RepID=A0A1I1XL16_9FIRM|nr:succinate CoA transferase [Succiniclasticum ruminis]SFE06453.1 succinyl-CoA:acetate CoA-transferase [Succiniclasticum ruminis DSM 9236]
MVGFEDIKDRVCESVVCKFKTAEEAAEMIKDGDCLGVSGFTPSGYPKAVPLALAEKAKKTPFKVNVWTGASVGPEIDAAMVEAGCMDRRLPYQTNATLRKAINAGKVRYADIHLSHFAQMARYGFMADRKKIDFAIVEVCKINDLGDGKVGLIPTTSMGNSSSYVATAPKVIVEVNTTQPVSLEGMHDSYVPLDPPNRKPIPIERPEDRIGTPYIPCELDKIVAVVPCDITDKVRPLGEIDEDAKHMGQNLVNFLKNEVKEGRLPANLLPLQSGVGSVANAVINGLVNSDFKDLTVYTEVIQDGMFDLIDAGKLRVASGTALTPSPECQKKFYENVDFYKKYLLLRPQEISNSPEVARRIGVIAMNTAIEVDIYGNVNSTHICGTKLMNGVGGSGDFARNGYLTVFFTNSLAKGGKISSVVPFCSHIDHATLDVDVIVSERGVADLRGLTPKEKAPIIIDQIANPKYQPYLYDYFKRACEKCGNSQTPHILSEAFDVYKWFEETGSMEKPAE